MQNGNALNAILAANTKIFTKTVTREGNTMQNETIRSIYVECRYWRQTSVGNTYNSVRISINGKFLAILEMEYGTDYAHRAAKYLRENGYDVPEQLWQIKNAGIDYYYSEIWCKRSEMFKNVA